MKTAIGSMLCVLSLVATGCGQSAPAKAPAASAASGTHDSAASPPASSSSVVTISDDIRRACGITDAEARFDFDSSRLRGDDYPGLKKLAACFKSGPMAAHELKLVGHADPRGDTDYNYVLGGSRADGVRSYLSNLGLASQRIATSSRDKLDATGHDEKTWAEDRRVDVMAAN
jgi:peptidoglycan-associated lipoprotein